MRKIVIMGATSGLGLDLAGRFVAKGWKVGAAGRSIEALRALKSRYPENVEYRVIDINKDGAEVEFLEFADALGGIDVYLHCSGVLPDESQLEESKDLLTVETNAVGFTRMIAAAYRYFHARSVKEGRDVRNPFRLAAISSIAGVRGLGDLPAYSASKAYDSAYLEALRQRADAEKLPLRIIDIRPGWTRTPLLKSTRRYLLETDAAPVARRIFGAVLKSRRGATICMRWKLLTSAMRLIPPALWEKIHIPLWREK